MRVLVDTHVFLWWVEGDRPLPARARAVLADPENECLISLVSAWEIAIKCGLGKLKLALPVKRYVVEHVAANGFRMLIAQALEEDLSFVTADPIFRKYGVKRVW